MPASDVLNAWLSLPLLITAAGAVVRCALHQDAEARGESTSVYSRCGVPVEVEKDPQVWWALLPTEDLRDLDDLALGPGARLRQTPLEAAQARLEALDRADLDPGAQAAFDAEDDAIEAARHLIDRAQFNARFHP